MDNKKMQNGRDKSRIDVNDPAEAEYVHQQFPNLSHEQIIQAIKEKGPSRQAVMNYLSTKGNRSHAN
ncbi:DUF3606 domain-containing protein [Ferruginibacter paludis]|uniref:DUF3606 domain-containing protein n=1 Tax=Ferruginibacter paludis TaxID=1310417 RepID=UPI0025B52C8D|nr:DUF3606 domain-containing protein [Ferruginibacter paludis]MDN3656180.1 DUF3606 domain-containing protein [Ferruginibacter paludis]